MQQGIVTQGSQKQQVHTVTEWECVLCCAVLCCAVLCCAVLCCAVLCCAYICRLLAQLLCDDRGRAVWTIIGLLLLFWVLCWL